MYNAHHVRRALPRELIRPRHLYKDRVARHRRIAADMKPSQQAKRAQTQAKRQATQAENAKKKAARETRRPTKRARVGSEDEDSTQESKSVDGEEGDGDSE